MTIIPTPLSGVFIVDIDKKDDMRGFFARTWDPAVAKQHELQERFDYSCISGNATKHTLRGMHFQQSPHDEVKLVRCTKGALFDVAVDLRPSSPTFKKWTAVELTAGNHRALYIPAGCAHGFLTLEDDTEVLYHIAGDYAPASAAGVRWNDPAFGIDWPAAPAVISDADAAYPDFV